MYEIRGVEGDYYIRNIETKRILSKSKREVVSFKTFSGAKRYCAKNNYQLKYQ